MAASSGDSMTRMRPSLTWSVARPAAARAFTRLVASSSSERRRIAFDATVSTTDAILNRIQEELPAESLRHLLSVRGAGIEIIELKISDGSPALGQSLRALPLPDDAVVALLIRHGDSRVPSANTMIERDDELVVVTPLLSEPRVREVLVGP